MVFNLFKDNSIYSVKSFDIEQHRDDLYFVIKMYVNGELRCYHGYGFCRTDWYRQSGYYHDNRFPSKGEFKIIMEQLFVFMIKFAFKYQGVKHDL